MKLYKYGMRLRPLGIGCQPKGFVKWDESLDGTYHNVIWYKDRLTDKQLKEYELDFLVEDDVNDKRQWK